MAGWRHTTIGRVPPRVISEASLEPKVGHPGSFRVAMKWGDAVSLPDGTDGGAVERDLVSVTLLSALTDARTAGHGSAEEAAEAAEAAIGHALDALLGASERPYEGEYRGGDDLAVAADQPAPVIPASPHRSGAPQEPLPPTRSKDPSRRAAPVCAHQLAGDLRVPLTPCTVMFNQSGLPR